MSVRTLFIASTPLVILQSAAVALAWGGEARLFLIEDFAEASRWRELLLRWRRSAFTEVTLLPGRHSEQVAMASDAPGAATRALAVQRIKRRLRRSSLATLRALDQDWRPQRVAVGNDRRVETQLALHLASRRVGHAVGVYLDDGLFTYLGDVNRRPLAGGFIDQTLKKLLYGSWWQYAAQVGSTDWIVDALLAYPELARDDSPLRARLPLQRGWFAHRALLEFALAALDEFGIARADLTKLDLLLALPHSRLLAAMPDGAEGLRALLGRLGATGVRCAVKHHPREASADPLGLAAEATLLPAGIAIELLLPFLPKAALVAGEASTALLSARWLRPDLVVLDLGLNTQPFAQRASVFLERLGVIALNGQQHGALALADELTRRVEERQTRAETLA